MFYAAVVPESPPELGDIDDFIRHAVSNPGPTHQNRDPEASPSKRWKPQVIILNEQIILHSGPIVFKFGLSVCPTLVWTLAVVDHQKSIFSI